MIHLLLEIKAPYLEHRKRITQILIDELKVAILDNDSPDVIEVGLVRENTEMFLKRSREEFMFSPDGENLVKFDEVLAKKDPFHKR